MLTPRLGLLWLLSSFPVFAAQPPAVVPEAAPELRGVLIAGGIRQFSLVAPDRGASAWVKIGQDFGGWELAEFKPAEESLVLKKEGRTLVLKLADSAVSQAPVPSAKATLADAEEVFRKMDFERMMSRIIEQQKTAMAAMTRQMGGGRAGVDNPEMAEFQKKTMNLFFDAMDLPGMKNDMVRFTARCSPRMSSRGCRSFMVRRPGRRWWTSSRKFPSG